MMRCPIARSEVQEKKKKVDANVERNARGARPLIEHIICFRILFHAFKNVRCSQFNNYSCWVVLSLEEVIAWPIKPPSNPRYLPT